MSCTLLEAQNNSSVSLSFVMIINFCWILSFSFSCEGSSLGEGTSSGILEDGLYKVSLSVSTSPSLIVSSSLASLSVPATQLSFNRAQAFITQHNNIILWHNRLGHWFMPSRVFIKIFIKTTTPYTRVERQSYYSIVVLGSSTGMGFLCTLDINEMRNGDCLFES